MSKAVPVAWEADPDPSKILVTITDEGKETVLRLSVGVASVVKAGVDPSNGFPIYTVNIQSQTSLISMDPGLRQKVPSMPGLSAPGNAYR